MAPTVAAIAHVCLNPVFFRRKHIVMVMRVCTKKTKQNLKHNKGTNKEPTRLKKRPKRNRNERKWRNNGSDISEMTDREEDE